MTIIGIGAITILCVTSAVAVFVLIAIWEGQPADSPPDD